MAANPVYYNFLDSVVAGSSSPQQIIQFRLPAETQRNFEELIAKSKETPLSKDELLEVNQILELEHVLRLLKSRAYRLVA